MCALARNSLGVAASIIHKMSPQSCKEPMTAYLAFKVAIRVEDRALAEKCLDTVSQAPDNVDYLGACIAESQKAGDITCAIAALRKLQERYEHREPNSIHLPALFRCTIRLLNLLADRPGVETNSIVNDLCEEFDAGQYRPVMRRWHLADFCSRSGTRPASRRRFPRTKTVHHRRARVVQPERLQPRVEEHGGVGAPLRGQNAHGMCQDHWPLPPGFRFQSRLVSEDTLLPFHHLIRARGPGTDTGQGRKAEARLCHHAKTRHGL